MSVERQWPSTVEEAVILLRRLLPAERLDVLVGLPEQALCLRHMDLGAFVREAFGLWQGNEALSRDCAQAPADTPPHPDEASMLIITRLWRELKDSCAGARFH